jgi:hypothetical protein
MEVEVYNAGLYRACPVVVSAYPVYLFPQNFHFSLRFLTKENKKTSRAASNGLLSHLKHADSLLFLLLCCARCCMRYASSALLGLFAALLEAVSTILSSEAEPGHPAASRAR